MKIFYCGLNPERKNQGDQQKNLPKKVTSASTVFFATSVENFYRSIIEAKTCISTSIVLTLAVKVKNTQSYPKIA